ncbi:MAG: hypothetical protein ABR521_13320 [Gaiellaceae bacterium]
MNRNRSLHSIEEDLLGGWLEDSIESGLRTLEVYLAKHAAFVAYLESR